MATARNALTPGDRAPNFFLPDHRDVIISLYDKIKGGPILVLFYRAQGDEESARELGAMFAEAPDLTRAGVHIFAIGNEPVAAISALAERYDLGIFLMSDNQAKAANAFGIAGEVTAYVLDPNQRVLARFHPGETPLATQALRAVREIARPEPYVASMHPPALLIPNVLDRELCSYLIAQYWTRGNVESGTFRMVEGEMVHAPNYAVKRRRDHHVIDNDLLDEIGAIIARRVVPEIRRAFHARITRVEEFKIVCYDPE
ncbi:MAG: redoxin domain-containing protein, partial [Alphaproteobacteria bacterium]